MVNGYSILGLVDDLLHKTKYFGNWCIELFAWITETIKGVIISMGKDFMLIELI